MTGRLEGIARRATSRGAMEPLDEVEVSMPRGIEGDVRGTPGPRQVTVLSREAWDAACRETDTDGQALTWMTRRANLLVSSIDLEASRGARLTVGEVELEVCLETDPCARMEAARSGLFAALVPAWRGGACCRVLRGGVVRVGDTVRIERLDAHAADVAPVANPTADVS